MRRAYAERSCAELDHLAHRFEARFLVTEWLCDELPLRHREAGFYVYGRAP